MTQARVLVVDDSALMRRVLSRMLEDAGFEVHSASDGRKALRAVRDLEPDVVTLDIHMPVMDGLDCLAELMEQAPRPVIMVSSLTEQGALATLEALALGALDYVAKPDGTISMNMDRVQDELVRKVKMAARQSLRRRPQPTPRRAAAPRPAPVAARQPPLVRSTDKTGVVLIGASTGGPSALEELLSGLPGDLPWPVLIAQHMPASFTPTFASRLDAADALTVTELSRATELRPGQAYLGRGGHDIVVSRRGTRIIANVVAEDPAFTWHPSVERMVLTAREQLPAERLMGVMLTGMGNDGAAAMAGLHAEGGVTIAQDEHTSVVFGMPRALIDAGGAALVRPLERIAEHIATTTAQGSAPCR